MLIKYSNFSENLVRIRKLKGLSQKDLASLTGISPRMIYHYEKHVSHPSMDKINVIANALSISTAELLGIDSNKTNKNDDQNFENLNVKTIKQLSKILKLNPIDRSNIYKMVDLLLQKEEYKQKIK